MKSRLLHGVLAATFTTLLVAATAVPLFVADARAETPAPDSAGTMLDDTIITTKVKAEFIKDERVSALRINVTSEKGIVQLSGFANSMAEATRAAEIARTIPGVKEVKNDIRLKQAP
jgi:osmotically-inducible protein OsmY